MQHIKSQEDAAVAAMDATMDVECDSAYHKNLQHAFEQKKVRHLLCPSAPSSALSCGAPSRFGFGVCNVPSTTNAILKCVTPHR